ncbi:MAG: GNAT family N-acetyltransferase [Actinomycetes bacterium]
MEYLTMGTPGLGQELTQQVRALLWDAFDDFSEHDWQHALGGVHVVAIDEGHVIGHASIISRPVSIGELTESAGYLEAVAVAADHQRQGIGTVVVRAVEQVLKDTYPFGVLSTSRHRFYERLGWRRWQGPTFAVEGDQRRRTADEDDGIMVRAGNRAFAVSDLSLPIAVESRPGDDW